MNDLVANGASSRGYSKKYFSARLLYVRDGLSCRDIAFKLEVAPTVIIRWKDEGNWESVRNDLIGGHAKRARAMLQLGEPEIDVKHDALFAALEEVIEDRVREATVDPHSHKTRELQDLVNALRECQAGRRLIRGQASQRKDVQVTPDPGVLARLAQLVQANAPQPARLEGDGEDRFEGRDDAR